MPKIKKISDLGAMENIKAKNIPDKTRINLRKKSDKK
jgi:uncharacterized protein YkvS